MGGRGEATVFGLKLLDLTGVATQLSSMRSAIWENFFRRDGKDYSETTMAFRQVPIFAGLKQRELRDIEKIVHQRDYHSGEAIFHQGDPGLGMYIILKGQVQIVNTQNPDNLIVYSELSDGDFFGDLALVDESDRSATALATADTRVVAFFRPELTDILTRFPNLGNKILMNLAKVTAQRLRRTNDLLIQAQQSSDGDKT